MIYCIRIVPLSKEIALLLLLIRIFTTVYFFTKVLTVVTVKYLIIFHGHYIELVNDKTVVKFSRLFCFIWSLTITLLDIQLIDRTKTADFLALTTGEDQKLNDSNREKPNGVIYLLILVNMFAIIFVQIQIEIYKVKGMGMDLSGYTLVFRRKIVVLILLLSLMILSRQFFPFANHNEKLIQYCVNQFFFMVIIPVVMIVKNQKILNYAKRLCPFPSCGTDVYSLNV